MDGHGQFWANIMVGKIIVLLVVINSETSMLLVSQTQPCSASPVDGHPAFEGL